MRRLLFVLAVTGCSDEVETDFEGLGEIAIDIELSGRYLGVLIEHGWHHPCPVLGDDFAGWVDDVAMAMAPGRWDDSPSLRPTSDGNYVSVDGSCERPWVGWSEAGFAKSALLRIGDRSRTVQCELGDLLAERRIVRVPDGDWTMSRGEKVTVQWSSIADLDSATFEASFRNADEDFPVTFDVPVIVEADLLSFVVPVGGLATGAVSLAVSASSYGEVSTEGCHGTPNRRTARHGVAQRIVLRPPGQ